MLVVFGPNGHTVTTYSISEIKGCSVVWLGLRHVRKQGQVLSAFLI